MKCRGWEYITATEMLGEFLKDGSWVGRWQQEGSVGVGSMCARTGGGGRKGMWEVEVDCGLGDAERATLGRELESGVAAWRGCRGWE